MDHSFFEDRLSAFYDGELKNEDKFIMAEHIENCLSCQARLDEYRMLDEKADELSKLSDSDYWEKSANKIDEAIAKSDKAEIIEVKKSTWQGMGWKITGLAASIMLLTFIGLYEEDIIENVPTPEYEIQSDQPALQPTETQSIAIDSVSQTDGRITTEVADQDISDRQEEAISKPAPDDIPELESPRGATQKNDQLIVDGIETSLKDKDVVTETRSELADIKKENIGIPAPVQNISKDKSLKRELSPIQVSQDEEKSLDSDLFESTTVANKILPQSLAAQEDESIGEALVKFDLSSPDLNHWQNKRDSLLGSEKIQKSKDSSSKPAANYARGKKQRSDKTVDKSLLLMECYYQIALLTDDDEERLEALKELSVYSESDNKSYRLQAEKYLQTLQDKGFSTEAGLKKK